MKERNRIHGYLLIGTALTLLYIIRSRSSDTPELEHGPAVGVVAPAEGGSSPHQAQPSRVSDDPLRPFFTALASVESNHDDTAVGDNGRSIGRYQIGRLYWLDSGVPGSYEDVLNPAYAEQVILAYWRRWCPDALASLDFETLARIHNGGPRGDRKSSTLPYWHKVNKILAASSSP